MNASEIDVVYPLGSGSKWLNNEIRYSLRSLEKFGMGVRNVYIIGECPSWAQNVYHIKAGDPLGPENADGNIITKVLQACTIDELSDEFLFINDDHLLLQPVDITRIPPYNKGTLQDFLNGKPNEGIYVKRLYRTLEILKQKKLTTLHYDCHVPIIINKHEFPRVMDRFDYHLSVGYGMKSLYGNTLKLPSPFLKDLNIKSSLTESSIERMTRGKIHVAYNDRGLNHEFMVWLEKKFYEPSKYETMDSKLSLLENAEMWLENPTSYSEGVQLYCALGKNRHLMNLAKADRVGRARKAIQKGLKAIVDDARAKGMYVRDLKGKKPETVKAQASKKEVNIDSKASKTVKIDDNPHIKVADLPGSLKDLYYRNKAITRELTPLHEKMKALDEDPQYDDKRQKLADQIGDLTKERKENWNTIDYWWQKNSNGEKEDDKPPVQPSGKLTKEEIEAIEDPAVRALSKQKRIKANINYISRYKDSDKKKQKDNVNQRMKEMNEWGEKY